MASTDEMLLPLAGRRWVKRWPAATNSNAKVSQKSLLLRFWVLLYTITRAPEII